MKQSEKPFACSLKGCEMSFTNEDHLNWHEKKHDMMLNLGLTCTKSNEVADQTPTPTRFIRNCEEVGLFQDLQNVNPFDEIFKRAVEGSKTSDTLEIPQTTSDDTLHTPQIYPHMEERQKNRPQQSVASSDFAPLHSPKSGSNVPMIIVESEVESDGKNHKKSKTSSNEELKKRIKEAIQLKSSSSITNINTNTSQNIKPQSTYLIPVPTDELRVNTTNDNQAVVLQSSSDPPTQQITRVREMNRAAQNRCRARKRIQRRNMESELANLRTENKKLKSLNLFLDSKVRELEAKLVTQDKKHKEFTINNKIPTSNKAPTTSSVLPLLQTSPQMPSPTVIMSNISRIASSTGSTQTRNRDFDSKTNNSANISNVSTTKIDRNSIVITIPQSGTFETNTCSTSDIKHTSSATQQSGTTGQQVIYIVSPTQATVNQNSAVPIVIFNNEDNLGSASTIIAENAQNGFRKIVPKLQILDDR